MDIGGFLEENPFGLVGKAVLNKDENFMEPVVSRFAGGAMDDFMGFGNGGNPVGGIVGMAMEYPGDEVADIIAQAAANMQNATGILEDKAAGFRADAEANQRMLGLIPAGITA